MYIKLFLITILSLSIISCKSSEDKGFEFLDNPEPVANDETIVELEIASFSPSENPVRVTDASSTTFVVSVNSSVGGVTYTWKLNDSILFVGTEPYLSFEGASAPTGLSNLEVIATNSISEASKVFILQKNTPPQIVSSVPGSTGHILFCGVGSLSMTVNASDADVDGLTYTWLLNGAVHTSYFAVTSGASTSNNVFSPPCSIAGANSITVEVSDGYDKVSTSWAVTVNNPTLATINSYTPVGSPVVINSNGSQLFSVSASGKDPLSYEWRLDGTPIPGENNAFITINAASLAAGEYTLTIEVSDADSSDTQDFQIKRNAPPVLSAPSPSTGSTHKMNYATLRTFSINGSDGNGDAITYNWFLNDLPSGTLAASATGFGHQAIFSPNSSLVGNHIIKVVATDGVETAQQSWNVNVNFFSTACNNLTAGQICTVAGDPGFGNGLYPVTDNENIKIRPTDVVDDGVGNLFITDTVNHVVWFHNRSASPITRLGKTIAAGQLVAIIGNGSTGIGPELYYNNNYKSRNPYGVAWDPTNEQLFVSLWTDHRVIRIDSNGQVFHDICNGNGNDPANNGGLASTHKCENPANIAFDPVRRYLYVAAYGGHQVKMFDLNDPLPANWTGHYMAGTNVRTSGAGTSADDGVLGTALAVRPYSMSIASNGLVFFTEFAGRCHLRVINNTGTNRTLMNGAVTVNTGRVSSITGGASCSSSAAGYATILLKEPRGLAVWEDSGANILGFFITNRDHHRVTFLNNTNSSITVGGFAVPALSGDFVWHSTTAAGYGGSSKPARNNPTNEPWGATVNFDNTELIIADYANLRVRTLDISQNNGNVTGLVGEGELLGYNGGSNSPATSIKMNQPTKLYFDSANNQLLFSDTINYRIRSINLSTGAENTLLGQGTSGAGNVEDEDPTNLRMQSPYAITSLNNFLIFLDNQGGGGTNRNCLVRAYNRSGNTNSIFNTSILNNRVSTIAGDYTQGCGNFTGNNAQARTVRLDMPEGLTTDGTNLFISLNQDHCILRMTPDGSISQYIGLCATEGDVNGVATGASIRLRYPSSIVIDPRHPTNFFIADQTNQAANKIKYVNLSGSDVVISGITVSNGQIGTVYTAGGYGYAVAAYDNQICFASGHNSNGWQGSHNVQCRDRDNPIPSTTMLAGRPDGDQTKAGTPYHDEQEGVAATSSYLYTPYGLVFDNNGNLYISERANHIIRMVKRWW